MNNTDKIMFQNAKGARAELSFFIRKDDVSIPAEKEAFLELLDDSIISDNIRALVRGLSMQDVYEIKEMSACKGDHTAIYPLFSLKRITFVASRGRNEHKGECKISVNGEYCASVFDSDMVKIL